MEQQEIEKIFENLKVATVEFYLASKKEDEAKVEKINKYKQLQLARTEAQSIKFNI
jgi:hypothetical protein